MVPSRRSSPAWFNVCSKMSPRPLEPINPRTSGHRPPCVADLTCLKEAVAAVGCKHATSVHPTRPYPGPLPTPSEVPPTAARTKVPYRFTLHGLRTYADYGWAQLHSPEGPRNAKRTGACSKRRHWGGPQLRARGVQGSLRGSPLDCHSPQSRSTTGKGCMATRLLQLRLRAWGPSCRRSHAFPT